MPLNIQWVLLNFMCPNYLFHRHTRRAYHYNARLAWYNVPYDHSCVKYDQLVQSANICDVSNQPFCAWVTHEFNNT